MKWAKQNEKDFYIFDKPSLISEANNNNLENLENRIDAKDLEKCIKEEYDIGIIADFGHLIPEFLLNSFSFSPILMHPSLLPKYRGAAPIQRVIMNHEPLSGVTILQVHPNKFDSGKILLQKTYQIDHSKSGFEITHELAALGSQAIISCLSNYSTYIQSSYEQTTSEATKAPKIKSSEFLISWESQTALQIFDTWRAIGPLTTTLYGFRGKQIENDKGLLVKINKFESPSNKFPLASPLDSKPGSIITHTNYIWCKCKGDDWIAISELQFASKKNQSAHSFINGSLLKKCTNQIFGKTF